MAARTFEVPERYRFLYEWVGEEPDIEAIRDGLPYSEISLQRTACFGSCPVYRVTFGRDGEALYEGFAFTELLGVHEGEVPLGAFARLSHAAERIEFSAMDSLYSIEVTDLPTVRVTITAADGGAKTVSDYGNQAPPEFLLFVQALDAIADGLEWTERPEA